MLTPEKQGGARPRTGEDEKLSKIIYEKLGLSKQQKKEKEINLAQESTAGSLNILKNDILSNPYA